MSAREAEFRAVPILSGFLDTLLQDVGASADTIWDCPEGTFRRAAEICRAFLEREGIPEMLADLGGAGWRSPSSGIAAAVGSDLYMTCAGHGVGFWDGDWGPEGEALTEAAEAVCRGLEAYVGDDGRVYIAGAE